MALASYTLQTDGQATSNSGGDISAEWWSLTPETGIGNSYQVLATIVKNQIDGGTLTGIFGRQIAISQDVTWSLDSSSEIEGVEIFLQIRESFTRIVQASATITLGFIDNSVVGDIYLSMNEAATNLRNSYFGTTFGTLNSDISLAIGDTITFSYTANNNNPVTGENLIESADGVNFFGFNSSPLVGTSDFVGYTATFNGVAINSGDRIASGNSAQYPVGGARDEHLVVLTATVATDVRFIGTSGCAMPIYDVTIQTVGQTFIYPIDSTSTTNPDSNGSGNNLVLTSNVFIINYPVVRNAGTDLTKLPYAVTDSANFSFASNNFNYAQPSLRVDGTGNSLDTNSSTRYFTTPSNPLLSYGSGFTVEVIVRFIGFSNQGTGSCCGVVTAASNSGGAGMWALGFDNYNGDNNNIRALLPQFAVLSRNTIYGQSVDQALLIADIRGVQGVDDVVSGNIYALMGTIRPSDNTVEFWINGESRGIVQLTQTQMDDYFFGNFAEFGVQDIKNGIFGTFIDVGARFINGAWRSGQDSHIQDVKIHLLEADDEFAKNQAATANFTT